MKIVYLTAGAAGMFCGSCMLDNAIAKAMIQLGHDCLLVPVYTPIRTDEEDVSLDKVFFGGINVYLQQKFPFLAYLPRWIDAALDNPSLIRRLTSKAGETSPKLLGALAVSMLRGMEGRQRKEVLRLCDWLERDSPADTILLSNLLIGGSIPELKKRFASKIVVILQGDDIFLDSLPSPYRDQAIAAMKRLVPLVDAFIVHSQDYGRRMADLLTIPNERIACVPLGIDIRDFQVSQIHQKADQGDSNSSRPPTVGYFARMSPEKGLDMLVDAFIELTRDTEKHRLVQLKMAGWMGSQHLTFWKEQQAKLEQAGLNGRWEYLGAIDRAEKVSFFRQIDLLCVPTNYQEPKGLFVLESVAAGVPYVQPAHGAFPELHQRIQRALEVSSVDTTSEKTTWGRLFKAKELHDLVQTLDSSLIELSHKPRSLPNLSALHQEIGIELMAQRIIEVLFLLTGQVSFPICVI